MPVDKFGRMSDTKTKDSGVSLTYINNNYVRSDGGTPLTGSLDMKGNIIYNVADPVNPQDVVTKVYVDNTKGSGVIGRRIGDSVSIKENMDFMGKQKIKNLPDPVNDHDAATKEYVDTTTVPFLKLDQTKYNTKGNIDMGDQFTILNVKTPINDNHITDKKYVDDNTAFIFRNNEYYAKGNIFLRNAKLGGLREPLQYGEATTKKYVDDLLTNHFIDENDNIAFGRNVDMEGKKIFDLPYPKQDDEPATKKYVDDSQFYELDKRGNIKFDRTINLDNKKIVSLKDPKRNGDGANKKYVDETIAKKIQEEKDTFLPQDAATKNYVDEAVRGIAGGNILVSKEGVFIKDNGHYRATAPLDIDNQKVENIPDPVDERDAVNRKYVDGIVEDLTLKQGLIRENGGFNLVDSYINMNFNHIRNLGNPIHEADAVPRSFVDEEIKTVIKRVFNQFNELNQLVSVCGSFYGNLKQNDYQFTFGGPILNGKLNDLDRFNGFLVPANGVLKHFATFSSGLILTIPGMSWKEIADKKFAPVIDLYGNPDSLVKIFSLVKIEEKGREEEVLGGIYFKFSNIRMSESEIVKHRADIKFKFIIAEKFRNKEENFICSVNRGDIINIRSEYEESKIDLISDTHFSFLFANYYVKGELPDVNFLEEEIYSLHTTTLTFLFKEMSFPNVLDDD